LNHIDAESLCLKCFAAYGKSGQAFLPASLTKIEEDKLKIIPVLDILDGVAVHAVRGKRKEYKPLRSVLFASVDPLEVAVAFKNLGFNELYVADLDAITGKKPNITVIKRISDETRLRLMVDAGVADLPRAEELLKNHVSKVVIGTETLSTIKFVGEAIECFGKDRVVVSLDLKDGRVLSKPELGKFRSPTGILRELQEMGLDQVIILDLSRVGSDEGVNIPLLKEIVSRFKLKVFVGGGVRDLKDLLELERMGVFGVLLATALHTGKIKVDEARDAGLDLS
jgi:phosphoribosylformimino-5-aminoimidazole carboxamide ribotide isomerase